MSSGKQQYAGVPTPLKPDAVAEFVKNARSRPLKATLWLGGKTLVYPTRLAPVERMMDRHIYLERDPASEHDELITSLAKANTEVFVLVWFSGQGRYAFRTRMIDLTGNGLKLEPPQEVLFLQRRRARRFVIPAAYVVEASLPVMVPDPDDDEAPARRENRRFRTFDVGEAGLSILVREDDLRLLPVGTTITDGTLLLRQRAIAFTGEIMNQERLSEPRAGLEHKVGIRFGSVSEQDLIFIQAYILEHSIQYHGGGSDKVRVKG